jgi:hypothetical protein
LAGTGVLIFGLAANAQYPPRSGSQEGYPRYQDEDRGRDPNVMFDRIQRNLERAQQGTFPFSAERARVSRAREALTEVQRDWNNGRLDRRALNEAIGSLERIMETNQLSDRNRDLLNFDLERLRDFRNSQGY